MSRPRHLSFNFRLGADLGGEEDLREYLLISEKDLEKALEDEESIRVENEYEIIVACDNEDQQKATYLKLTQLGYKCKVLTL